MGPPRDGGGDADGRRDATVDCHPTLFDHLLENLLSNAVDHAVPAAAVEVGVTDRGFYVADDGPGIPAADRETVFEPGHTTTPGGAGFGLAIVRSVADRHGWTVTASERDGGGARFDVGLRPAYRDRGVASAAD